MASSYPSGLDSFDAIASDKKTSDAVGGRTHRDMHNDLGDAIEAIETELGTTPSGSESTVAARLDKIEDGTRLAANSVGATQLADSAVDTAAIADGAVTPAKLATTGRFVFPTGAANGYGFASGAVNLSGTGAPEGAVTAAPGSTWLQIGDAITVSGNLSWRKATGTGNTGWIAEGALADTGWQDISASFTGGYTSPGALVRRVGAVVQVRCYSGTTPTLTDSDWNTLVNLPAGFRPYSTIDPVDWNAGFGGDIRRACVSIAGDVRLMGAGAPVAAMTLHAEFTTTASWPTTNP